METVFAVLFAVVTVAVIARASIASSPGGFEAWRVRRRHRRAKPIAIGDLPENQLGLITGEVTATDALVVAPLTGRACVYYAVIVQHHHDRRWEVIVDERRGTGFALTDRTGRAVIEPSNAQLALCFDRSESAGWLDRTTREQEAILARHGVTRGGGLLDKKLRFREAVIEVGDRISVIGAGIREISGIAGGETDYRSNTPTQIRITNSAEAPLSLVDESLR
jgi:hypothetical protein